VAKALIKARANLEAGPLLDSSPLFMAAYWGRLDVVKELVHAGAEINAMSSNGTPLNIAENSCPAIADDAVKDNCTDIADYLRAHGGH